MKLRLALVTACCLGLAACSTFHLPKLHMPSVHMPKIWPFHKKAKTGPEAVNELTLVNADGSAASYPQYWVRNTLVIDLSGVAGQGNFAARLPEEATWPVRVALRVQPGRVGQLEVVAEERNILPVTDQGAKPIDIELSPTLYTPKTAAIYISWGPAAVVTDSAPEAPAEPVFVSPTEVPKAATEGGEPAAEATSGAATDIIAPADAAAAPAQPSPGT